MSLFARPSLMRHNHANTLKTGRLCIKDWNRFKKENSAENLTYSAVKNIYSGLLLVFLHRFLFIYLFIYLFYLFTLFVHRTNRERRVMFYYYYFYYYYYYYYYY